MKMNIKLIVPAALAAALACSCAPKAAKQTEAMPAEEAVPTVAVEQAVKEKVVRSSVYSANVQANAINNIASQSGNRIVKLNVEVGDYVTAGQVLAEMDNTQLEQTRLQFANYEAELKRTKDLLDQGGISQSDYDQMELSFRVSKNSLKNLEDNTILRSPINGIVTARNYDSGDMYTMATPIYTVQQIIPVKVLVGISEADYTKVKIGDKVTVTADALPGKTFTGSIVRIYPILDSSTHTVTVEVHVANTGRELRPGMYARVTVTFGSSESIVVPDAAVIKQQGSGQRIVYVLGQDSTVEARMVGIGQHFDSKYEITDGLKAGETVVVKGQSALRSGTKVQVQQ